LNKDAQEREALRSRPRIAVAALNPHAGEGGLFVVGTRLRSPFGTNGTIVICPDQTYLKSSTLAGQLGRLADAQAHASDSLSKYREAEFRSRFGAPRSSAALSVKGHPMNTGTVKFYNDQKGFGFIQPDNGGKDVFVHATALERAGIFGLREGQKVAFDTAEDRRSGKTAVNNIQTA
jgi:CspA family cold shock protein